MEKRKRQDDDSTGSTGPIENISKFLKDKGFQDLEIYLVSTSPIQKSWMFQSKTGLLIYETSLFLVYHDIIVFGMSFYSYDNNIIYVEKVDSTGYYPHKNSLFKTVIQAVLSTFGGKTVHIFARSQPQLLFPESIKNPKKNIHNERNLVLWWSKTLSNTCKKGYFYVPGESKSSLRDISSVLNKNWEFGLPWDLNSKVENLIPIFPDDVKSKALKLLDANSTIQDFENILQVTGECGSGRFSGFFILEIQEKRDSRIDLQENLDYENYRTLYKTLMNSDFSSRESALKSSQKMLEFIRNQGIKSERLPKINSITLKDEQENVSEKPIVILSSNLIKKKGFRAEKN